MPTEQGRVVQPTALLTGPGVLERSGGSLCVREFYERVSTWHPADDLLLALGTGLLAVKLDVQDPTDRAKMPGQLHRRHVLWQITNVNGMCSGIGPFRLYM
jgi:hypothetical protein